MTAGLQDDPAALRTIVSLAVERGRRHLLELQDERGWWRADAGDEVGREAEDVLFREFVRVRQPDLTSAAARWIRSRQRGDGGWGSTSDLTVSVLAYCALRVAGDSADAYHMALAAGWIRDAGGLARAGARAQIWLALHGEADWGELPVPLPEAVYLAASYAEPSRGRQQGVAMSVIGAYRPVRRLPFGLAELRAAAPAEQARGNVRPRPASRMAGVRAAALRKCGAAILAAQQPDGTWRGDWPVSLFSMIALQLQGCGPEHPAMARGMAALDSAATWTGSGAGRIRRLTAGSATAAGTALVMSALADAGLAPDDGRLVAAGTWLLADDLHRRAAGIGECGHILAALRAVTLPAQAGQLAGSMAFARRLAATQRKDGGWLEPAAGALVARGGSSARLTALALSGLTVTGPPGSRPVRRAVACLLRDQRPDGSWPDDQGNGAVAPTAAALRALAMAGVLARKPSIARAVRWLLKRQNPDGGWGYEPESARSATMPTAAALLALLTGGAGTAEAAIGRGVAWLARIQRPDGHWPGQDGADAGPLAAQAAGLSALARYLATGAAPAVPGQRAAAEEESASLPARSGGPTLASP